jgi:hypothetical protein
MGQIDSHVFDCSPEPLQITKGNRKADTCAVFPKFWCSLLSYPPCGQSSGVICATPTISTMQTHALIFADTCGNFRQRSAVRVLTLQPYA